MVCLFITRGQEILPEVFGPHHEYFTWSKLDIGTDTDDTNDAKKLVAEAFHNVTGDVFQGQNVDHHVVFFVNICSSCAMYQKYLFIN